MRIYNDYHPSRPGSYAQRHTEPYEESKDVEGNPTSHAVTFDAQDARPNRHGALTG